MKTVASLTFRPDGTATGLYTEAVDLTQLGRLQVTRATRIIFDHGLQAWRVRDRTGTCLFTARSRQACLEWEQEHFLAMD